jgi:uncharacterized MAPEG superfamily protein
MSINPHDAATWLAASTALTGCLWIPYVLNRLGAIGVARALDNPQPGDIEALSPWARRVRLAHANAIENLVVFAPLALLAIVLGLGRAPIVADAAATFFFARLAHFAFYTMGIPVLRTVAFVIGFVAQALLLVVLVGAAQ